MVTRSVIRARKVAVLDKQGNNIMTKEIVGSGAITRAEKRAIAEELCVKPNDFSVVTIENIVSQYAISEADFLTYAVCVDGMSKEEIKKAIGE